MSQSLFAPNAIRALPETARGKVEVFTLRKLRPRSGGRSRLDKSRVTTGSLRRWTRRWFSQR
jgi:hypothetical protein